MHSKGRNLWDNKITLLKEVSMSAYSNKLTHKSWIAKFKHRKVIMYYWPIWVVKKVFSVENTTPHYWSYGLRDFTYWLLKGYLNRSIWKTTQFLPLHNIESSFSTRAYKLILTFQANEHAYQYIRISKSSLTKICSDLWVETHDLQHTQEHLY